MILVGVFVLGKNACHFEGSNWNFGGFGEQGKGELVTERRSVSEFTEISNSISATIEWRTGDAWEMEITAQKNILDLLKTDVDGSTLEIGFNQNVGSHKEITIRVTSPKLEGVNIAGSGDFFAKSPLQSEKVKFSIGGSGSINVPELTTASLDCNIAGSGDMEIGGTAEGVEIGISGSGTADAKRLTANELEASIAGSGDVYCGVKTKLKANIAGSGSVHYTGDPSVQSHVMGSGDVVKD